MIKVAQLVGLYFFLVILQYFCMHTGKYFFFETNYSLAYLGRLYRTAKSPRPMTTLLDLPNVHNDLAFKGWHTATYLSIETASVR